MPDRIFVRYDKDLIMAFMNQTAVANVALTAGKLVYMLSTGKIGLASAVNGTKRPIGVIKQDVAAGQAVPIYTVGTADSSYPAGTFTPGALLYLDPASDGGLTATKPTTTGQLIAEVGFAYNDHTVVFRNFSNFTTA